MERAPTPPSHGPVQPETSPAPPKKENGGFFERWRKKMAGETAAQKSTPEQQSKPETPPETRRGFGKNVLNFLFGKNTEVSQSAPETVVAPETLPHYERAGRLRRFARAVIGHALSEARHEPERARAHDGPEVAPLDTSPLIDAAEDLRGATDDLTTTMHDARELPLHPPETVAAARDAGGFDYDGRGAEPLPAPTAELPPLSAAERIDYRLRRLEADSEATKTAALAAIGLGVIAVLVTGAEYLGRKSEVRKVARDVKKNDAETTKAFAAQRAEFAQLRRERAEDMNRTERQGYYERLSTFTHEQAERTRAASRDLQEVTNEAVQHPQAAAASPSPERTAQQPRQPERAAQPEQSTRPLARVEVAERTEQSAAPGQVGNAGTGFFGGGGAGAGLRGIFTKPATQVPLDPKSAEARRLEALRKAQAAQLRSNAWLYSAGLVLAIVALVLTTIFVG